ncbi:MAG: hypothetical protein ACRCVQ_00340 [Acinetobacter ursingii]|nr:hypothetical protein [Acinetobacter sp. WU_MDCI_Axc73]
MDSSNDDVKTGNPRDPLIELIFDGDRANRLLLGNLVRILVDKGVLDLDEYIGEVEAFKSDVAIKLDGDTQVDVITRAFEWHINDFKKLD